MSIIIVHDAQLQTLEFFVFDTADGYTPQTGLANTNIDSAFYVRDREAPVAISTSDLASVTSGHSSGGFIELDATNMPGLYRFDIPDAAVLFGSVAARVVVQLRFKVAANAQAEPITIQLQVDRAIWDVLRSRHTALLKMGETIDALTPTRGTIEPDFSTASAVLTNLTEADDFWNGALIVITGGNLDGQSRQIVDFANTNGVITVNPPFTAAPSSSDNFVLLTSPGDMLHIIEELPQAAPAAEPQAREVLALVNMIVRNEIVTGTGSQDIKNDAGTVVFKHAISFASGPKTTTRGELTSGP